MLSSLNAQFLGSQVDEFSLPSHGSDEQIKSRHSEAVLLWNANSDSCIHLAESEIAAVVITAETSNTPRTLSSKPSDLACVQALEEVEMSFSANRNDTC